MKEIFLAHEILPPVAEDQYAINAARIAEKIEEGFRIEAVVQWPKRRVAIYNMSMINDQPYAHVEKLSYTSPDDLSQDDACERVFQRILAEYGPENMCAQSPTQELAEQYGFDDPGYVTVYMVRD